MDRDLDTWKVAFEQVRIALVESLKDADSLDKKCTVTLGYAVSVIGILTILLSRVVVPIKDPIAGSIAFLAFLAFFLGGLRVLWCLLKVYKTEAYYSNGHLLECWNEASERYHTLSGLYEMLIINYRSMAQVNNEINALKGKYINDAFFWTLGTVATTVILSLAFVGWLLWQS